MSLNVKVHNDSSLVLSWQLKGTSDGRTYSVKYWSLDDEEGTKEEVEDLRTSTLTLTELGESRGQMAVREH